jgi:phosphoenolpyruvate mutase
MISNLCRIASLKHCIARQGCIRVIECHSPIAALIVQSSRVDMKGEKDRSFDAFWSSSLADSAVSGLPDTEFLSIDTRLRRASDILDVTSLPMLFDADTGGSADHFARRISQFERLGVSAAVIEDKVGFKQNSLLEDHSVHQQATVREFCHKLDLARRSRTIEDFLLVARCESLILGAGLKDALARSFAYVEAGADAVLIHSKSRSPDEVFAFARDFRKSCPDTILICVPTTYNETRFADFIKHGFNVVIYANHIFRASFGAIQKVARDILRFDRTWEADRYCEPIADVVEMFRTAQNRPEDWVG